MRKQSASRSTRDCPGFTLVEMLVVLIIVGFVLAIAAPAIYATLKSATLSNAVNQVSSYLAMARSMAMRDNKDMAVVFFATDDETIEYRVLQVEVHAEEEVIELESVEDRPVEVLHPDVRMVGPDFRSPNDGNLLEWLPPDQNWLGVWFAPDGTTRTSDANGDGDMRFDEDRSGTGEIHERVIPVPFLALYDVREFEAAGSPVNLNGWFIELAVKARDDGSDVTGVAQVLMFNRYTGVLMASP